MRTGNDGGRRDMLKMRLVGALLAAFGMVQAASAETVVQRVDSQSASFRVVQLLSNLDHPWSMAWLPDGEALIGLRPHRTRNKAGFLVR
jgi:glucose/arabinose dehydrogenase